MWYVWGQHPLAKSAADTAVLCLQGQDLAKSLAEVGISVTLIPDTHMYAMMRRVNKVIIGTHTIMAEGGYVLCALL